MPEHSSDVRKFLILGIVLGVVADGLLIVIENLGSAENANDYIDYAGAFLLGISVSILLMIIPKVVHAGFRWVVTLIATGFVFQFVYALLWIYYVHYDPLGRMPYVSVGDFFYLGSYVLWTAATIPYLRRYGNLMGAKSKVMLLFYGVAAAVIIFMSTDFWYDYAVTYDYDRFTTAVWLSYAIVPTVCLAFPIAATLLYGFEGYGKGLLRYYWLYFLIPIIIIAAADIVNGFMYTIDETFDPGSIDDFLYLGAYSATIAACVTVIRSPLESATTVVTKEGRAANVKETVMIRGRGYIVEDPDATRSYELFSKLLAATPDGKPAKQGLVLTQENPAQAIAKYKLTGTRVIWISSVSAEDTVDPTKPSLLAHTIMEFFSKVPEGVVLFQGIEKVVVHNDFNRILRMLEQINDFVMQYQRYLIIPIDPAAFEDRERAILERNFETLKFTA